MKLSDLKIGTRLYLGFGIVIVLLAAMVAIACANFVKLTRANDLNIHTYQVLQEGSLMLESLINIETGQRGYGLTGNTASLEPYEAGKSAFNEHLDKARLLTADNAEQQARLQQLEADQRRWLTDAVDPVIELRRGVADGKTDMAGVVALVQQGKGKQGMDAMRGLLGQFESAEKSLLTERAAEAAVLRSQTFNVLIGGGILCALLSMMVAAWLARNITRPLQTAVDLASRVAEGDLTVAIDASSRDEVGQLLGALQNMNASLVKIVSQVRSGTDTIAAASTQIAEGNMDLSSRTEQQAGSLEETASSMEELTSTVKQNADNARQANHLAASASDIAARGGAVVAQVVDTMGSINASSKKIVDIISVIDGIAFQTNILALNAAVEAARAGEQGRGFAVVAAEVRTLAQRSAAAAKEIKELIGDSVEKVDAGAKLVNEAGSTMTEIVGSIRRVTDIMGEITAASQEQTAGIEQINTAIAQMDEVTQQNAALVEEAAAAQSMQHQAGNLSQLVGVFTLAGDGMRGGAKAIARAPKAAPALASSVAAPKALRAPLDKSDWEEF